MVDSVPPVQDFHPIREVHPKLAPVHRRTIAKADDEVFCRINTSAYSLSVEPLARLLHRAYLRDIALSISLRSVQPALANLWSSAKHNCSFHVVPTVLKSCSCRIQRHGPDAAVIW